MTTAQSAQPCGCDPGMDWLCERHREASFTAEELDIIHAALNAAVYKDFGRTESEYVLKALYLVESRR